MSDFKARLVRAEGRDSVGLSGGGREQAIGSRRERVVRELTGAFGMVSDGRMTGKSERVWITGGS